MTRKPTTNERFHRATLREAANGLTNGLIDQMRDILKHTAQENLRGACESRQTALNVMQAAAVLRIVHDYAYMTSRRLEQIASVMQLGEGTGDNPDYIELCERAGPDCNCEVVCKYKPKRLHAKGEKAFADAEQQSRQCAQDEPPNG